MSQSQREMRPLRGWILPFFLSAAAFPQAPAPPLTFEVASVKPSLPPSGDRRVFTFGGGRGGPGSNDPGRLTFMNTTLMNLITQAYNVKNYQVTAPAWIETERYDVLAKLPETNQPVTKEQSAIMLQNLLADRFHLTLHHDSKEFQGFELVVGKNGSKLKESSPEDAAFDQNTPPQNPGGAPPPPPQRDANGFMKMDRPGLAVMMQMSPKGMVSKMTARAQTIPRLLDIIGSQLNKPLSDKTGLTGKYDFTLEYAAEIPVGMMIAAGGPPPPPPPPGGGQPSAGDTPDDLAPALPTAIQQQLGLRLDAKKVKLDVLIIDGADRVPTEN